MEADTDIHSVALGQTLGVQLKRGSGDYKSKGVKIMMELTETADVTLWELTDSELTARKSAWDQPRHSATG